MTLLKFYYTRQNVFDSAKNESYTQGTFTVFVNRPTEYNIAIQLMKNAIDGLEKMLAQCQKDKTVPKNRFQFRENAEKPKNLVEKPAPLPIPEAPAVETPAPAAPIKKKK